MPERGESSRPRGEGVREDVPETAVDIRGFITDVITVSYDTIPGYVMPRITIDETPEEERGEYQDIHLDAIPSGVTEPFSALEIESRGDQAVEPVETDRDIEGEAGEEPTDDAPDTEYRGRSSTPVRGRVMRFDGYTDSDDDDGDDDDEVPETDPEEADDYDDDDDAEGGAGYDTGSGPYEGDADMDPAEDEHDVDDAPESDPDEDPEEAPSEEEAPVHGGPAGYLDDMGTTADDIIESSTARIDELEGQVQHLEVQNEVHQYMEDLYRDMAHQREAEAAELRQAQSELVSQLEGQTTRADRMQAERDAARAELREVTQDLHVQRAMKEILQDVWIRATERVTELEGQVRDSTARIDAALFAFDTAMGRLRSRIRRYPRDEDMTRRAIDRRVVDHMIYQEHRDAVSRVTRD